MSYAGFNTYAEMVSAAMRSQADAEPWFSFLKMRKERSEEECRILKAERPKHPGLTNTEILAKYRGYLERNFPVPSFEEQK